MKIPCIISPDSKSGNILRISTESRDSREITAVTLAEKMHEHQKRSGHVSVLMEESSMPFVSIVYAAFKIFYERCPKGKAVLLVPDNQAAEYLDEIAAQNQDILNGKKREQEIKPSYIDESESCVCQWEEKLRKIETIPFSKTLLPESIQLFREYMEQTRVLLGKKKPTGLFSSAIDKAIDSIFDLLKDAKSEGSDIRTISICFNGIRFGLARTWGEIPVQSSVSDIADRCVKMLTWYQTLVLTSMKADNYNMETCREWESHMLLVRYLNSIDKKSAMFKEEHQADFTGDLDMTSGEQSCFNNQDERRIPVLKLAEDLQSVIEKEEQLLRRMDQNNISLKSSVSAMALRLPTWESMIASASMKDFQCIEKLFVTIQV